MTDKYDLQAAAAWRLLVNAIESGTVQVVMLGEGSGADGRTAGMIASDADEVVDHLITGLHAEYPEGIPFEFREEVALLEGE